MKCYLGRSIEGVDLFCSKKWGHKGECCFELKQADVYKIEMDSARLEGFACGRRRAMEKVEWVLSDVEKRCIDDHKWVFETIRKDLGITKEVRE